MSPPPRDWTAYSRDSILQDHYRCAPWEKIYLDLEEMKAYIVVKLGNEY